MVGDDLAQRLLGPGPYPRLTPRTKTSWGRLRKDLAHVRSEGFAVSEEEFETGLVSLAVPLAAGGGDQPLAINVSLPSQRATGVNRRAVLERLQEAGERIETSLKVAA
jgi:IclR family pca regulon transcriptional regulator